VGVSKPFVTLLQKRNVERKHYYQLGCEIFSTIIHSPSNRPTRKILKDFDKSLPTDWTLIAGTNSGKKKNKSRQTKKSLSLVKSTPGLKQLWNSEKRLATTMNILPENPNRHLRTDMSSKNDTSSKVSTTPNLRTTPNLHPTPKSNVSHVGIKKNSVVDGLS
jgi:hypothetical protein